MGLGKLSRGEDRDATWLTSSQTGTGFVLNGSGRSGVKPTTAVNEGCCTLMKRRQFHNISERVCLNYKINDSSWLLHTVCTGWKIVGARLAVKIFAVHAGCGW
jgi:hypothetical protein